MKKEVIRQSGFIAQEVKAVIQSLGIYFKGVDTPQSEKDFYGIRYAEFVVPLTKAVQELCTKNYELEALNQKQNKLISKIQEDNETIKNELLIALIILEQE